MRKYSKKYSAYDVDHTADINSFYVNLNGTSFKEITSKKLLVLKCYSKELNNFFNNKYIDLNKTSRYVKIMNRIKGNSKQYNITTEAEKFILFMFSVDPTFEVAKIYGECNKTSEVKQKFENKFGIYDPNLIKIENFFIKHFLSQNKKNEINEEIQRRVYK